MAKKVEPEQTTIVVSREQALSIPDIYAKVYIEADNDSEYRMFAEMFAKAGCWKADTIEGADLVVFGGGADVSPLLYDTTKHPSTHTDYLRDLRDKALYDDCYQLGIPMLGVCRGAQFGAVMAGGKLFQDVDGHGKSHSFTSVRDGQTFTTSSSHHQMVKPNIDFEILGVASGVSTKRFSDPLISENGWNRDIEAFFIKKTGFFGVQGHPEYSGYPQFTAWTLKMLLTLFVDNPDYGLSGDVRRLRSDLLESRQKELSKSLELITKELN